MSNLSTLPKGDSAWLLRKAIERIMEQVSVLETNIGSSTTGNSANTQIIFNDNGTLRGDAGLVYNKTTDALTVAGNVQAASATITGAATVGTTLGVTSSLTVGTGANAAVLKASFLGGYSVFENSAGTGNPSITFNNDLDTGIRNPAANTLVFDAGGFEQYRIASSGVFTWADGAGGTRMTLNSTGLGIGVASASIASNLHVKGASGTVSIRVEAVTDGLLGLIGAASGLITGSPANNLALRAENGLYLSGGGNSPQFILNSSGNLGIGVTPSAKLDVQTSAGRFKVENFGGSSVKLTSSASFGFVATEHQFLLGATQAMTLDASGNLLVGKTASSTSVAGAQVQPDGTHSAVKSDANPGFFYNTTTAISGTIALFRSNGVTVGSISQDGTNTAYNLSSDYRLKEQVQPLVGGLARVNSLKPSIYKWKTNGSNGEGFLAHELAEVVPFAVTGPKDAMNEDGTINPQGVDLSKIVPILVAAIQELTAEVNALKNA